MVKSYRKTLLWSQTLLVLPRNLESFVTLSKKCARLQQKYKKAGVLLKKSSFGFLKRKNEKNENLKK